MKDYKHFAEARDLKVSFAKFKSRGLVTYY